jgi:excisionase family DNA binding protein
MSEGAGPAPGDYDALPAWYELTIGEAASVLRVSQGHVRNAVAMGLLRAARLAGRGRGVWRVRKADLEAYRQAGTTAAAGGTPASRERRPAAAAGVRAPAAPVSPRLHLRPPPAAVPRPGG